MESRQSDFWFYASLEFRDFINTERTCRFCVKWYPTLVPNPNIPRGFIEEGPENYRQQPDDDA